tara:strand:+ start:204 stop:434 length:231 start_codon:yes stop_codon:yes gene_type:complete
MIIDLEPIYKKVIYVLVRKNHKIRLRKAEKETIIYDGSSVEDGYDKILELLKDNKRIKTTNMFGRLWQRATNFWRP